MGPLGANRLREEANSAQNKYDLVRQDRDLIEVRRKRGLGSSIWEREEANSAHNKHDL